MKGSEFIQARGSPTYAEIGFLSKHRSQSLEKDSKEDSEGMVRRLSRPNRHPQINDETQEGDRRKEKGGLDWANRLG